MSTVRKTASAAALAGAREYVSHRQFQVPRAVIVAADAIQSVSGPFELTLTELLKSAKSEQQKWVVVALTDHYLVEITYKGPVGEGGLDPDAPEVAKARCFPIGSIVALRLRAQVVAVDRVDDSDSAVWEPTWSVRFKKGAQVDLPNVAGIDDVLAGIRARRS